MLVVESLIFKEYIRYKQSKEGHPPMFRTMNQIFLEDMQGSTIDEIPLGNWLVRFDDIKQIFYLDKTTDFSIPDKIYGNATELATRYLNTYRSWDGNLGVLLSGMKGTGKSLLAKQICSIAEVPVIMIQHAYGGSGFLSFLSKISQPVIVFLDEFEKVYTDDEQQNMLLSILDGTFNSKFLFLLTINEINRMNGYMMNRPSRIHYHQKYTGMGDDMIEEICLDLLDDKEKLEGVLTVCTYVGEISMDIIISLIREVNLYPEESPMSVLKYMNLTPSNLSYNIKIIRDGKVMTEDGYTQNSPLIGERIYVDWGGENIETIDNTDPNDLDEDEKLHDPKEFTWNEFHIDIPKSTIKVSNGIIRIDHNEEFTDGTDTKWVFIYTRTKPTRMSYF